jgi:hypothetical protein
MLSAGESSLREIGGEFVSREKLLGVFSCPLNP